MERPNPEVVERGVSKGRHRGTIEEKSQISLIKKDDF